MSFLTRHPVLRIALIVVMFFVAAAMSWSWFLPGDDFSVVNLCLAVAVQVIFGYLVVLTVTEVVRRRAHDRGGRGRGGRADRQATPLTGGRWCSRS